jgi:peroxiredoxin Q/BCP
MLPAPFILKTEGNFTKGNKGNEGGTGCLRLHPETDSLPGGVINSSQVAESSLPSVSSAQALFLFRFIVNIPFLLNRPEPLEIGAPAPKISALDHDGARIDLASYYERGLTLVYFYPKADTPGCTAQGCSLRDAFDGLTRDGLSILGVSNDRPEGQKKFREKYRLPYPLVADFEGKVAKAFGVPTVLGFAMRQSFLIRDGRIVWVSRSAKTTRHAEEVREAIAKLL